MSGRVGTGMADKELAAGLLLAAGAGLLSIRNVVKCVDKEIVSRGAPEPWLIEASLAPEPQDVLHALRERAQEHPMLSDPLALLTAVELAARNQHFNRDLLVSVVLRLYPYAGLPADLGDPLWQLDEEATCAHAHGGIPQPAHVERALRALLSAVRGRSEWGRVLESVLEEVARHA